jgi:hypothetical protein
MTKINSGNVGQFIIVKDKDKQNEKNTDLSESSPRSSISCCAECSYALPMETKLFLDGEEEIVVFCRIHEYIRLAYSKPCKWKNKKNNGAETDVSLATYIRHSIHHPENSLNVKFTPEELQQSIEKLRELKYENK